MEPYKVIDGESLTVVLQEESIYFGDTWVFWYDDSPPKGTNKNDYESAVKELGTFSTVQEFWRLWTSLNDIKSLPEYSNLRMFRKGIKPMWEDTANTNGGKWVVPAATIAEAERLWSIVIMASIGEQLDGDIDVNGVVLSLRPKENVLQLWTRSAVNDPLKQSVVRNVLHQKLELHPDVDIIFQLHFTSLEFTRNFVKKPRSKKKKPKKPNLDPNAPASNEETESRDTPTPTSGMEESDGEELPYFIPISAYSPDATTFKNNPKTPSPDASPRSDTISPSLPNLSPHNNSSVSPALMPPSPRKSPSFSSHSSSGSPSYPSLRSSPLSNQQSPRNNVLPPQLLAPAQPSRNIYPQPTTPPHIIAPPHWESQRPASATPHWDSQRPASASPHYDPQRPASVTYPHTKSDSPRVTHAIAPHLSAARPTPQEPAQQKSGNPPSPVQPRARSHSFDPPSTIYGGSLAAMRPLTPNPTPMKRSLTPNFTTSTNTTQPHAVYQPTQTQPIYHPPVSRSPPHSSSPSVSFQTNPTSPPRPPSKFGKSASPMFTPANPNPSSGANRPPSRSSPYQGSSLKSPSRSSSTSPSFHNRSYHQIQVAELLRRVSRATEQPLNTYIDMKEDHTAAAFISQLVSMSLRKQRSSNFGVTVAPTPTRSSPSASSSNSPLDSPNLPSSPRLMPQFLYSGSSAFSVKKIQDNSPPSSVSPESADISTTHAKKIPDMLLDANTPIVNSSPPLAESSPRESDQPGDFPSPPVEKFSTDILYKSENSKLRNSLASLELQEAQEHGAGYELIVGERDIEPPAIIEKAAKSSVTELQVTPLDGWDVGSGVDSADTCSNSDTHFGDNIFPRDESSSGVIRRKPANVDNGPVDTMVNCNMTNNTATYGVK